MLTIFYDAPLAIQIHIISALVALGLGPVVLWRRKGDRLHRILGYVWVTEMAVTALSSFFIVEHPVIGPFSPIHLLSAWTLWVLWHGIAAARAGDIARHRGELRGLYLYGLGIAGSLTLLPGRRLNAALFGEAEHLGLWAIGLIGLVIAVTMLRNRIRIFSLVKVPELR